MKIKIYLILAFLIFLPSIISPPKGKKGSFLGKKRQSSLDLFIKKNPPTLPLNDINKEPPYKYIYSGSLALCSFGYHKQVQNVEETFKDLCSKDKYDSTIGNSGIVFFKNEKNEFLEDEYPIIKYGRKLDKLEHTEKEIIKYIDEYYSNVNEIFLYSFYSPCFTCIEFLYNFSSEKKKKINVFYASNYLENKYLKEKEQNDEENNLSLFLYSLKNTSFNGLNLNEADNLKAKNDIILEKYNEILAGQHDTEYLTFHHFIKNSN